MKLIDVTKYDFEIDHRWQIKSEPMKLEYNTLLALIEARKMLPDGYNFIILSANRTLKEQRRLVLKMEKELKQEEPDNWEKLLNKYTGGYQELKLKPEEISYMNHRSGKAVDLTLSKNGKELDLGLEKGNATLSSADKLYYSGNKISKNAKLNRKLLAKVLKNNDFENYPMEWWHWGYSK